MTAPSLPDRASIGSVAAHGLFWSVIQNWGGRALNFGLFVLLARFLTPAEFGIAAAAQIIIVMITLLAEFGFTDAIIQRPQLEREDVNLPFYFSVSLSVLLAMAVILASGRIEAWLGVPGTRPVVVALAILAPINTVSLFQEMHFKRNLAFQRLAVRVLVANTLAGVVSVAMAVTGYGVWAIVAQSYVATLVGLIWMWLRPFWTPTLALRPAAFASLARFSVSILAMRLLDFGSTRLVELITVGRYGVRAYGLYAASSRLSQTLLDMLQSVLGDVALSVLSKVSSERERLAAIYRMSAIFAANLLSPFFLLAAALSTELCDVLFGDRWIGIGTVARPLFLLGAVQVIQFLSRPYLSARGKSGTVFLIAACKFAVVMTGLVLLPHGSVYQLVVVFVCLQLATAPISFAFTARELGVPLRGLALDLLPVAMAGLFADRAVWLARPWLGIESPLLSGACLGMLFVAVYGVVLLLVGRRQLLMVLDFVRKRLGEGRRSA